MKPLIFILAASFLVSMAAGSASAAIVSYSYQGLPLLLPVDEIDAAAEEELPAVWPAYSGVMIIDEDALPGRSLVNAAVAFIGNPPESDEPDWAEGLVFFSVFPFPATAGAVLTFTTDAERRITSWDGDFMDGPPDGGISSTLGDYFFVSDGGGFTYSAAPGTWAAPTIVPLPATGALLAAALAGLVLAGGRIRRRSPSGLSRSP